MKIAADPFEEEVPQRLLRQAAVETQHEESGTRKGSQQRFTLPPQLQAALHHLLMLLLFLRLSQRQQGLVVPLVAATAYRHHWTLRRIPLFFL